MEQLFMKFYQTSFKLNKTESVSLDFMADFLSSNFKYLLKSTDAVEFLQALLS